MSSEDSGLSRTSVKIPACLIGSRSSSSPAAAFYLLTALGMPEVHAEDTGSVTELAPVTVTAMPFDDHGELDMAQPVSVLKGDELRRKREASIGDTLSKELGVSSSFYGPAAGRPIIRGMDGPRIRVLENAIGTLDVSTISPDHMVTTETLNVSQVEIVRGPATLLYGSGASGGVVNVVTDRIPSRIFGNPKGSLELRGNSATEERTGAFNLNTSAGQVSFHLDGFKRKTGDYHIPDRADSQDSDGEDGVVRNSAIDSSSLAAGASFVGERGLVGASISHLGSKYGIPGAEGAKIDLEQTRYDTAGELDNPLTGFKQLKVRIGHNDYQHAELESTGEVGTLFRNEGTEGRVELLHDPLAGWQGVIGAQLQNRNFSALGEEVVVPATQSRSTGMFLVEERHWDRWRLEFGGRLERVTNNPQDPDANPARAFNLSSFSASTLWKFKKGYDLGITATRAQRAPSIEELYSNGPHHGTLSFDIGDEDLGKETSNNIDLALRKADGMARWKVNFFYNHIQNYIFQRSVDADNNGVADRVNDEGTADPDGELLVQRFAHAGARFYGLEAETTLNLLQDRFALRLFTDLTRAKLDDGNNVARIPPMRYGLDVDYRQGAWGSSLNVMRVTGQNRVAPLETPTPGYTLLNTELTYRTKSQRLGKQTLFLQGKNLLDAEARVHTSFLKDVAPLPGRALVLGIRSDF